MKENGSPKPYELHSLLDLIDHDTLSYIITGYRRRIKMGYIALFCYGKNNELKILEPQTVEQADLDEDFRSEICRAFRESSYEAKKACAECNRRQAEKYFDRAKETNTKDIKPITFCCTPLGLTHIIAPIIVKDKLIGLISVGQRIIVSIPLGDDKKDMWGRRLIPAKQEEGIKSIKKIIKKSHSEMEKKLLKALDEDLYKTINSSLCEKTGIESLKNSVAKYAEKLAKLCSIIATDKILNRQKEFLSYLVKNISEANLETEDKWIETLRDSLNDYMRFIGKENHARIIAVYHGDRDDKKVNYKLVVANSNAWNLKLFSENAPEGIELLECTPPYYIGAPKLLTATLNDEQKKYYYVYRFAHTSGKNAEIYSVIILQCDDNLSEESKKFHREFCDTLCRQKATIRLLLQQTESYENYAQHVTESRHALLTSMQQVTSNIDNYLIELGGKNKQIPVDRLITKSVKDLQNLIKDIKPPDQLEKTKHSENVDLFGTIDQQISLYQASARKKGFKIDSRGLPTYKDVRVKCNPTSLSVAIASIIENAIKYSFYNNRGVVVTGGIKGKEAVIQVENFGIGIPPDKLEEIKNKYVRGEVVDKRVREREGTGLGLAIATDFFCNVLHGELEIKSKPYGKDVFDGDDTEAYHRYLTTVTILMPI